MSKSFSMILRSYLNARTLSPKQVENLQRVAESCQAISRDSVNAYLKARLESVSSVTVANERRMLLTLWRWAYESEVLQVAPRGIMPIHQRSKPIKAWTEAQVRNLIQSAQVFNGRFRCGLAKRFLMTAWARLGYETGARWGDLWAMRFTDIDVDTIRWTMSKTGDHMSRPLSVPCLVEVQRLQAYSPDGRILGWACNKRYAMRLWRELCDAAGLDGTSRWLRRSSATHVELRAPGKARVFLGHRTHGMADRHYIDRTQIRRDAVVVPSLD